MCVGDVGSKRGGSGLLMPKTGSGRDPVFCKLFPLPGVTGVDAAFPLSPKIPRSGFVRTNEFARLDGGVLASDVE